MIKSVREIRILAALHEHKALSVHELCALLDDASAVTVRRDLARLARRGALVRTHGGAVWPAAPTDAAGAAGELIDPPAPNGPGASAPGDELDLRSLDAIILPPIPGRWAGTLRLRARRRGIPFLAESSPQEGGVYLGPDNLAAGRDVGRVAGRMLRELVGEARLLTITLEELANTRERAQGFLEGLEETFAGPVASWCVDGKGAFATALRASLDAFQAHPGINVVFGVNDHSVMAALEAADRLGVADLRAFSVGAEGQALLDRLAGGRRLKACAALFPEVVGRRAVDVLALALAGEPMPAEVRTPHAVLTADNLPAFYRPTSAGWLLVPEAMARFAGDGRADRALEVPSAADGRRPSIGFLPHYPAHDWYRNMARAMRERAAERGLELRVAPPAAGVAQEITALRRQIAGAARRRVRPGDTILVNGGEVSLLLAEELGDAREVTVVTNSLDVLERLGGRPGLKVILTSGEYQPRSRCLVGPSLAALLETLRIDKAFLAVDGITARFGLSAGDDRLALAAKRFVDASREVLVMADHSVVGVDAHVRIAPVAAATEIITDSGTLPVDRLALAASGARIVLADEQSSEGDEPGRSPADGFPRQAAPN
jgi:DeoR/GlpR family transcriptional regulator of sugar metabolism